MKIAVSSDGPTLTASVDPRFGRCACFMILDTDDMQWEVVENSSNRLATGAGIQTAQMIAGKGVRCVLTGSCGPNALQVLSAAGIEVYNGCTGTVEEMVAQFREGHLLPSAKTESSGNLAVGMGKGGGGGRGMGGGSGRGMGRCRQTPGMGAFGGIRLNGEIPFVNTKAEIPDRGHTLEAIKQQADALKREMEILQNKIKELEGNDE